MLGCDDGWSKGLEEGGIDGCVLGCEDGWDVGFDLGLKSKKTLGHVKSVGTKPHGNALYATKEFVYSVARSLLAFNAH